MIAIDLFAGTGWGVACKALGIYECGVELMPEARRVRAANGMKNDYYDDVWDSLEALEPRKNYDLLIASPPCQTFSLAGKGEGRAALDEVCRAIYDGLYESADELYYFGKRHDERTALVLSPLAQVWRDRPDYVVFEQVPPAILVWELCAEKMREWGYSVATGVLNAEQYGVPQTRRRAVLIGQKYGQAMLPAPTHSAYYPRNPERLDAGVLPWVSMADALGWGLTNKPSHTITAGTHGAADRWASGGKSVRAKLEAEIEGPNWRRPDGKLINLDPSKPATTVAGDPRLSSRSHHYHGEQNSTSTRITVAEAAALQTYPADFDWSSVTATSAYKQIGNAVPPLLAQAILETLL